MGKYTHNLRTTNGGVQRALAASQLSQADQVNNRIIVTHHPSDDIVRANASQTSIDAMVKGYSPEAVVLAGASEIETVSGRIDRGQGPHTVSDVLGDAQSPETVAELTSLANSPYYGYGERLDSPYPTYSRPDSPYAPQVRADSPYGQPHSPYAPRNTNDVIRDVRNPYSPLAKAAAMAAFVSVLFAYCDEAYATHASLLLKLESTEAAYAAHKRHRASHATALAREEDAEYYDAQTAAEIKLIREDVARSEQQLDKIYDRMVDLQQSNQQYYLEYTDRRVRQADSLHEALIEHNKQPQLGYQIDFDKIDQARMQRALLKHSPIADAADKIASMGYSPLRLEFNRRLRYDMKLVRMLVKHGGVSVSQAKLAVNTLSDKLDAIHAEEMAHMPADALARHDLRQKLKMLQRMQPQLIALRRVPQLAGRVDALSERIAALPTLTYELGSGRRVDEDSDVKTAVAVNTSVVDRRQTEARVAQQALALTDTSAVFSPDARTIVGAKNVAQAVALLEQSDAFEAGPGQLSKLGFFGTSPRPMPVGKAAREAFEAELRGAASSTGVGSTPTLIMPGSAAPVA